MIKTQLNIASLQGDDALVQERLMQVILSRRLEKLFKDFSLRATLIKCEPYDSRKKGTYRLIGKFLMLWNKL